MKNIQNKWIRAAIPALLLHCSIGTVYCWSIFSQEIANYIGFSKGATEWAFSFAIFSWACPPLFWAMWWKRISTAPR